MPGRGRVFLIGAGPGDPELLTLKAVRMLEVADTVVHDRLVPETVLDMTPPDAKRIFVGKESGRHHVSQDDINALLVRLATAGRTVARVKGGDPFIFGRGGEEALCLTRHGIPWEVAPGLTAASGAAAACGVPLTHRGLATGVRLVTGHARGDGTLTLDWDGLADPETTLAIYMGLATLPDLVATLATRGLPGSTPAMAVSDATTQDQRRVISSLEALPSTVAAAGLRAPALIVIGRVVALARVLDPTTRLEVNEVLEVGNA